MLQVRNVSKFFRSATSLTTAIVDISIDLARGTRLALVGPSGCGKTSLLRCIAGLETPDSGSIAIDGRMVFDSASGVNIPPWDRSVGMVFQSYALWPHMTVLQNVIFPLRNAQPKFPKRSREERARSALALVELDELRGRYPSELSGGQQQRVAVARALVSDPKVLLLDEPLSSLDQALRKSTRRELADVLDARHVTSILVTHDELDGFCLAHEMALMTDGRLIQHGTPRELYEVPMNIQAASILGSGSVVFCRVRGGVGGECQLIFPNSGQYIEVNEIPDSEFVFLMIRPDACALIAEGRPTAGGVLLRGIVQRVTYAGSAIRCAVSVDGTNLELIVGNDDITKEGAEVRVAVDTKRLHVFPHGHGRRVSG